MKTMEYTYNYEPEMYKYILSSNILNIKKKEDEVFKLLVLGYNCKEIGEKLNFSERTIQNRRKVIFEKTKKYMIKIEPNQENLENKKFNVYLLTFPNSKVYVGITYRDEEKRWLNGNGYKDNEIMYSDILKIGWDNIKKNVLYRNLSFEEARKKETELIIHYKSHLKRYGYNRNF